MAGAFVCTVEGGLHPQHCQGLRKSFGPLTAPPPLVGDHSGRKAHAFHRRKTMFKTKLSDNFALAEFIKPDDYVRFRDNDMRPLFEQRLMILAQTLELIRAYVDSPLFVTSGWRSPQRNLLVGGSKTSDHPTGWAADFKSPYMNAWRLFREVKTMRFGGLIDFDQLIEYPKHVHISVNPRMRGQSW